MIANRYGSVEAVRKYLDVDTLGYLSLEGMLQCMKYSEKHYCTACWSGKYAVPPCATGKFSLEMGCCGEDKETAGRKKK